MLVETGEQSFLITGKDADVGPYRSGVVEIDAEINYLADKRVDFPVLDANFDSLKVAIGALVQKEKRLVEARQKQGFSAARALARQPNDDIEHEKLLGLTYRMLNETRGKLDELEVEQIRYGDKVPRFR